MRGGRARRRRTSPGQFAERFGPTEQDYQAVIAFAEANSLAVTARHPNRLVLGVEGSVADIEKVFHLTMRLYQHPSESRTFYAPDAEPSLDLAIPISDISGLDNYSIPQPRHKEKSLIKTANEVPQGGSGPSGTYRGLPVKPSTSAAT